MVRLIEDGAEPFLVFLDDPLGLAPVGVITSYSIHYTKLYDPGEETLREKALYMMYFAPWDWIAVFDGDGAFSATDLPALVEPVAAGHAGHRNNFV